MKLLSKCLSRKFVTLDSWRMAWSHTDTPLKNRQLDIFSRLVESTPILLVWVEAVEVEAYC